MVIPKKTSHPNRCRTQFAQRRTGEEAVLSRCHLEGSCFFTLKDTAEIMYRKCACLVLFACCDDDEMPNAKCQMGNVEVLQMHELMGSEGSEYEVQRIWKRGHHKTALCILPEGCRTTAMRMFGKGFVFMRCCRNEPPVTLGPMRWG